MFAVDVEYLPKRTDVAEKERIRSIQRAAGRASVGEGWEEGDIHSVMFEFKTWSALKVAVDRLCKIPSVRVTAMVAGFPGDHLLRPLLRTGRLR